MESAEKTEPYFLSANLKKHFKQYLHSYAYSFLELIFPATCPVCKGPAPSVPYTPFCPDCWGEIEPYNGPSCQICGEPFTSEHGIHCSNCLKDPPPFTKAYSFGLYGGVLEEAIKTFKFGKQKTLSRPLGEMLCSIKDLPEADAVVAVPLVKKALLERGFNQSLLLASVFSKITGIPLLPHALMKIKDTSPQAMMNRKERLLSLKGAFSARDVTGKKIIIVDDVMTTGATMRECSKTLIKAGASQVFSVTLARAGQ